MRAAFSKHLSELMTKDTRVVIVLADIGRYQFKDCPQDRVFDVGISEQTAIDVAAGMSLAGLRPVVYGIAPFIVERAYEQIKIAAYNEASITIVTCGASYDYAYEGDTHHCPNDVAILSMIPGVRVFIPGTGQEAARLFDKVHGRGMNYIRLSDHENESSLPVNPGETYTVSLCDSDVTVIAFGNMLDTARLAIGERPVNLVYATEWPVDDKSLIGGKIITVADFAIDRVPFVHDIVSRREDLKDIVEGLRGAIDGWTK